MKQIKERWGEIKKGTIIKVKTDYSFMRFNDKKSVLPKGNYYVCGFWCDAMGLSKTNSGFNDFVVPSKALMFFYDKVEVKV